MMSFRAIASTVTFLLLQFPESILYRGRNSTDKAIATQTNRDRPNQIYLNRPVPNSELDTSTILW